MTLAFPACMDLYLLHLASVKIRFDVKVHRMAALSGLAYYSSYQVTILACWYVHVLI